MTTDTENDGHPFDEVALAYAKHWSALEIAREQLVEQWSGLLDALVQGDAGTLKTQALEYHATSMTDRHGLVTHYFDIQRQFAQAKRERGVNVRYSDGIQIMSVVEPKHGLMASVELYFRMNRWRYEHLAAVLKDLDGRRLGVRFEERYAYLPLERVAIDQDDVQERLGAALESSWRAFVDADDALAEAVRHKAI